MNHYCSSLVGGERSHERIWSLALSCWFSSQDSGLVFLLGALTFILDYFFLLKSLGFFLSSFNLNSSQLNPLLCSLVLMRIYILVSSSIISLTILDFFGFSNLNKFIVSWDFIGVSLCEVMYSVTFLIVIRHSTLV